MEYEFGWLDGSEVGRMLKFGSEAAASSFLTWTRVLMAKAMNEKAARMPYNIKMLS